MYNTNNNMTKSAIHPFLVLLFCNLLHIHNHQKRLSDITKWPTLLWLFFSSILPSFFSYNNDNVSIENNLSKGWIDFLLCCYMENKKLQSTPLTFACALFSTATPPPTAAFLPNLLCNTTGLFFFVVSRFMKRNYLIIVTNSVSECFVHVKVVLPWW